MKMNTDYEYTIVRVILMIYKMLGLAPYSVKTSSVSKLSNNEKWWNLGPFYFSPSRFGCLYNLLLIAIYLRILYTAIPLGLTEDYVYKSVITVNFGLFIWILGNSTILVIYIVFAFRQNTIVRQLNRLLNINGKIILSNGNRTLMSSFYFFLILFLIYFIVWVKVMTGHVISYKFIGIFRIKWPTMIVGWFMIQYICVIKLIYNRLKTVNEILLDRFGASSVDYTQRLFVMKDVTLIESPIPTIMIIRHVHTELYEIATKLSEFYSLPILLAIGHFSVTLIFGAYYSILYFIMKIEAGQDLIINALAFMMLSMFPIIVLSSGITNFTLEMKRTRDIVNKFLILSNIKGDDRTELKQLALELMHRKVHFTACKLFSLDCTLVHSIASMVATYLVILLQHQMER